jgi:hypothetical protein
MARKYVNLSVDISTVVDIIAKTFGVVLLSMINVFRNGGQGDDTNHFHTIQLLKSIIIHF